MVDPGVAALVNGAMIHGLDFDDTHLAALTHVSTVVVPVALALGQSLGAPGREIVRAIFIGHEGQQLLAFRSLSGHH